jgi:cephalosporin hydroxylase
MESSFSLTDLYRQAFFKDLIIKTQNFGHVKWLGQPIWQNILDLWTMQETICEVQPALLIECGTNRGGSALFYAHLFDLLGKGRVLTIDVESMHQLSHPRIRFLIGSSIDLAVARMVREEAAQSAAPVLVILDSNHAADHVFREMELYGPLVTPGSYLLVQDGIMDLMDMLRGPGPGPLAAIQKFLPQHPEFEVDTEKCGRFLITHHPMGWLRRRA